MAESRRRESSTPAESLVDTDRCSSAREAESDNTADLSFVRRLIARDADAWSEFLERYQRLIYARVLAAAREIADVIPVDELEDACADVAAILLRDDCAALKAFAGRSKFSTWLAVVSRRLALAHFTRRQRESAAVDRMTTAAELDDLAARGPDGPADDLDCSPTMLAECLKRLSANDRSVLEMYYYQNRSYQAVASDLGIAVNSVGPKLSRAQRRLRRLIEIARRNSSTDGPIHRDGRRADGRS